MKIDLWDLEPGQLISYGGKPAQIVWSGTFSILSNYTVKDLRAVTMFFTGAGRFKTITQEKNARWVGDYFYSKENIGADGL